MTPSSIDLCCSATPWRTWRSSLFKEEREREYDVCVRTTNEGKRRAKKHVQTDKKREIFCAQRERKRDIQTPGFYSLIFIVFTELR